ncbi:hypothetical protein BKP45_03595 [Anaerobacillus alkalidiazotrophicus]|uniref:ATP synthase subunit n=1 Tax=Anaerobacillus alkalidiazotrophicus TaxID=472963 RepID=A0A1S2MBF4_9BACI|nr:ATP synthase subunit I [Anaerobacillus alkalidiazotrophicus]OIJ21793.1 hypothetical protein BKP45_03595 [Anaerobacillus alkalidiazotrophicus]
MEDYIALTKRYTFYITIIVSIFLILAFITPYKSIFLGLFLGSVMSLGKLWSTYFQVKRIGESLDKGRAKWSLGTMFRMLLVLATVYFASQYPDQFHFISVIIGLMLTYIIIMVHSLFQLKYL